MALNKVSIALGSLLVSVQVARKPGRGWCVENLNDRARHAKQSNTKQCRDRSRILRIHYTHITHHMLADDQSDDRLSRHFGHFAYVVIKIRFQIDSPDVDIGVLVWRD